MTRGTLERVGPASKSQGPLLGREPKESSRVRCGTLFWEEPQKQRSAVPQDAGKTPSVCPSHRESTKYRSDENEEEQLLRNRDLTIDLYSCCL